METLRYAMRLSKLSSCSSRVEGLMTVVLLFLLPTSLIAHTHTNFIFNQFNMSALELQGNASVQSTAISLTGRLQFSMGRAFYPHPVRMKDPASLDSTFSFSTTFVFSIVSSLPSQTGFGLAFFMTPDRSLDRSFPNAYFGLIRNSSVMGNSSNHLFAVEFDHLKDLEFEDINSNHVGVDVNDLKSLDSKAAGYWINSSRFQELDLKSGQNIQAWIDYDHLQMELNVTIVQAGLNRPHKPLLYVKNISLSNILEEEMYVGFSAATANIYEENYIVAWSFTTNGTALPLNTSSLPSFIPRKSKSSNHKMIAAVSIACVVLSFLVVVVVWLKRNQYREVMEEWEMEYWPHRFKYKELHVATKGFREEGLLGSGGFGRVYRGVLPTSGLQVAVKSIVRETNDGVKEFIAELSSLGRLQHRNLVHIRGFCRRGKQLFIVYDYMPNGSLDKMIFGNPQNMVVWDQRYKIIRDVAAGLLYLHEEWEQCVVHRDIKSSNVLLDSEMNGKLGDFGLARLYERNKSSHTTRVVGTLGYIAPELAQTGKASPCTDVFSFGIFMLEVACGRRPVDPSVDAAETIMVEWVRELQGRGSVMEAADPNLGGQYVESEVERVLKLGLLCSSRNPQGRLGMRQVVQILEEKAPIPRFDDPFYLELSSQNSVFKCPEDYSCSSISKSLDAR